MTCSRSTRPMLSRQDWRCTAPGTTGVREAGVPRESGHARHSEEDDNGHRHHRLRPGRADPGHEAARARPPRHRQLARHGAGQGPRRLGLGPFRGRRSRRPSASSAARRRRGASPTPPPTARSSSTRPSAAHSLEALEAAGAANLAGKILVDVANPLDFSKGMPPTLLFCNTESLGERIQAAFPDARVVKSLNTTTALVMVDPRQLTEPTTMFVSGNDQEAKDWVHQRTARALVRLGAGAGPRRHHGGPWHRRCGCPSG